MTNNCLLEYHQLVLNLEANLMNVHVLITYKYTHKICVHEQRSLGRGLLKLSFHSQELNQGIAKLVGKNI